jgi:hypothetical protein
MHKAPEGYVAVAGEPRHSIVDRCRGCVFWSNKTTCPWCYDHDIDDLLCVAIANEHPEHDNIIFQEATTQAVPEKLDMHNLQHRKLLMALDELVNDYEANNGGMPTLQKLIDWAEKQARATDHMSLHPGV